MKGKGTVLVEVRADLECRLHTEPRQQIACNKRRGEARLEGNAPGRDTDGPANERNGFRFRERAVITVCLNPSRLRFVESPSPPADSCGGRRPWPEHAKTTQGFRTRLTGAHTPHQR